MIAGRAAEWPDGLVSRGFVLLAPDRLWVADITYVSTWSDWVYVALVTDAYARTIVGWLGYHDDYPAGVGRVGAGDLDSVTRRP